MTAQAAAESAAILTRGVVAKSHRDRGVFSKLLAAASRLAWERSAPILVGVVAAGNTQSRSILVAWGFTSFGSTTSDGWTGEHFYKAANGPDR